MLFMCVHVYHLVGPSVLVMCVHVYLLVGPSVLFMWTNSIGDLLV